MQKLKQSFLTIAIGLALAAGLSYAWTGPTANPPGNNASAPVNVSNSSQIKTGALQVNGFRNIGSSIFDGSSEFKSSIKIPTSAGAGKILTSDAYGNASWAEGGTGGGVGGNGTANYVPKWTSNTSLGNSTIRENSGGYVGIGMTPDSGNPYKITVNGKILSLGGNVVVADSGWNTKAALLEDGTIYSTVGDKTAGNVLTSDGYGNGSWKPPTATHAVTKIKTGFLEKTTCGSWSNTIDVGFTIMGAFVAPYSDRWTVANDWHGAYVSSYSWSGNVLTIKTDIVGKNCDPETFNWIAFGY